MQRLVWLMIIELLCNSTADIKYKCKNATDFGNYDDDYFTITRMHTCTYVSKYLVCMYSFCKLVVMMMMMI